MTNSFPLKFPINQIAMVQAQNDTQDVQTRVTTLRRQRGRSIGKILGNVYLIEQTWFEPRGIHKYQMVFF